MDVENWKNSDVVAPWYEAWNAPATPAKRRSEAEGQQLGADGIDAHHLRRDLVLADGHPGAAHPRALQVPGDDDADEQQHECRDRPR